MSARVEQGDFVFIPKLVHLQTVNTRLRRGVYSVQVGLRADTAANVALETKIDCPNTGANVMLDVPANQSLANGGFNVALDGDVNIIASSTAAANPSWISFLRLGDL